LDKQTVYIPAGDRHVALMAVLWRRAMSMAAGLEARATKEKDVTEVGVTDTALTPSDCSNRAARTGDIGAACGQKVARTKEALAPRAAGNSSEPLEMETVAAPVVGSKDVTVTRSGESESDDAGEG
jgi:hypothetical protein